MKLELKHLKLYLDHKLLAGFGGSDNKYIISGLGIEGDGCERAYFHLSETRTVWYKLTSFYPVMRMLSSLTRQELIDKGFTTHLDYLTHEHQEYPETFPICSAPYDMVQYLISKHYDIFGLIPQGLAWSMDDLKITNQ